MGGRFYWWIGQVMDSKFWRDNLTGNKTPSDKIPGWGYRYKVRSMGIHEKDESVISLSGVLPMGGVSEGYDYDDETGIVVNPGDPKSLREAMLKLLKKMGLRLLSPMML